jgi:Reverse transcriptase (RNA-dependent DNA polymerase)
MTSDDAIQSALRNIANYGDTDIFPFPFETLVFVDNLTESTAVLKEIHADFKGWLSSYPPQTIPTLTQVGYTGFRWAHLIDPFWNAYYLSLVISIADQIEEQRIRDADQSVFSYRFQWHDSEAKLFRESTWINFRKRCVELSSSYSLVVQTDISDFYPRIYHHRVENALHRLSNPGDTPSRIMELLGSFSKNVSYGLPIGGPASRVLAELALHGVDTLLVRKGINFCRYADDYALFCNTKADAYRILVFLSEKLANEGLVLQKKKTRIISADEFRRTAQMLDPADVTDNLATEEQKLLNISIRYDPYSPTAAEDYELLREAVSQIDIIGILGRELGKATIDSSVSKQAIQAISALSSPQREEALKMLLDENNLMTLAPVFVTVMRIVRDLYAMCSDAFQAEIDEILCDLYRQQSPLLSVETHLAYYLQALAGNQTQRKEEILGEIFEDVANPLIRRFVILAMAKWRCFYWLSDVKNKYGAMSIFERRAFLIASYYLGEEGKHWRDYTKPAWRSPELLIRNWFSNRFQSNKSVPL